MKRGMIPFLGGSYEAVSKDISSQNCINCYLEKQNGMNAKVEYALLGTPGTKLFTDLNDTGTADYTWCRGLFTSTTGSLFAVFGTNLYKIDGENQYELILTNISGSSIGKVSFAESLFYLILCDGVRMYFYRYDNGAKGIVDSYPENALPKQVAWIGGRMVAINAGINEVEKNKVYYSQSGPENVINWSGEDTGSFAAEQSADPISSMQVSNGYLWLFGPRSYEIHQPTFNIDDPFDLINSTTNSVGCTADLGTTEISDFIFFLGSAQAGTQQIFMSKGFDVQPISTKAIEHQIDEFYSKNILLDDLNIDSYSQAGHLFVIFTFIKANKTWVYDLSEGLWHERRTYNNSTPYSDRWQFLHVEEFQNKIITTAPNGKLLRLDNSTYTDYDETTITKPLIMEYTGPVYWDGLYKMQINEMYIDMETGVGSGQIIDQSFEPKIVIESSRDGGYSWGNSRIYSLGKVGNRFHTVRIRKLGVSRAHVLRLRISDPVKRIILGARVTQSTSVVS